MNKYVFCHEFGGGPHPTRSVPVDAEGTQRTTPGRWRVFGSVAELAVEALRDAILPRFAGQHATTGVSPTAFSAASRVVGSGLRRRFEV